MSDNVGADSTWRLVVSSDGRRLERADGRPWFWLGDTAWALLSRLGREDTERYFANRRAKGFTVIQAVAAMGYNQPIDMPNVYGHAAFVDGDPTRLATSADGSEDFWTHVDFVIDAAARHGLYIGLLPLWGYYVGGNQGSPVVFNADNAHVYAEWIAERYKGRPNIIWINGGDVAGDENGQTDIDIWRIFGRTIKSVDPDHLMTFHPAGKHSSATLFGDDDWLDFNMIQTGHSARHLPNDLAITEGYERAGAKPIVDGEPPYEDHPVRWNPSNGFFGPADVRQAAYWSLFAGAFGHTYGHVNVWRFNVPGVVRGNDRFEMQDLDWAEVIDRPGAYQMKYVRNLMLSRPAAGRVPDQSMLTEPQGEGGGHLRATRGDGFAMAYSPWGRTIDVDLRSLPWSESVAWLYDPRTGASQPIDVPRHDGTYSFDLPGEPMEANDWVLVIDDASRGFAPPGTAVE